MERPRDGAPVGTNSLQHAAPNRSAPRAAPQPYLSLRPILLTSFLSLFCDRRLCSPSMAPKSQKSHRIDKADPRRPHIILRTLPSFSFSTPTESVNVHFSLHATRTPQDKLRLMAAPCMSLCSSRWLTRCSLAFRRYREHHHSPHIRGQLIRVLCWRPHQRRSCISHFRVVCSGVDRQTCR
ncbi:hypothetical protein C8Q70DRAFT_1006942 [Cubamyces menziesii]|nr:hypothetical protein C8Q70DRAFT_1006942 [Cubamyces menziesii]